MSHFHIKLFLIFFFSILLCSFCISYKVYAADYYVCSGDISNPGDIWDTSDCSSGSNGFTPVSGDTLHINGSIVIEYANIEYTVELMGGASVDMGGAGGVINIINDIFTIQSGASLILNASGFNINNATLNNYGTIQNDLGKNLVITGGGVLNNHATLDNSGTVTVESGSSLNNIAGSTNNNVDGIITNIGIITNQSLGTIYNYGTINNQNTSTFTNSSTVYNDGTFDNQVGATFTNSDVFENNNVAVFENDGTSTNTGVFTNSSTATLNNNGTFTNNKTLTNNGIWTRTGGTISTGATATTTNNNENTYSIINASLPYNLSAQTGNGATNYNAVLSHTPTSWSATGLPAGLSISNSTGIISGTPATTSSGTLYVTSTGSSATQAVGFSVSDIVVPIVDIQGEPVSVSNTTPFTITFEFSENVTGFAIGDIVVVNASLSSFVVVDGNTYTVSVTPTGAGNITIDVPVNSSQDANANGNTAATQVIVIYISSTGVSVSGSAPSRKSPLAPVTFISPQMNPVSPLTPNDTLVCTELISTYIRPGSTTNVQEVKDLQTFLNAYEAETLVVDGVYKQVDMDAVKRFQTKYASEILAPWGLTESTGLVYQTTKAKINLMYCGQTKGCPYFTQYHKLGSNGGDVKKIQNFLNLLFGQGTLQETGVFDKKTFDTVSKYQTFYKKTVLNPWKITQATGYWYQSTRLSANKLMGCFEGERRLDNGALLQ